LTVAEKGKKLREQVRNVTVTLLFFHATAMTDTLQFT